MLSMYPAIFYHEEDNGYAVVFPDLNHLSTSGDTYQEAMEMAVDCLAGYLYELKNSKQLIPQPTPINKVDISLEADEDDDYSAEDISITMVSVDVEEYAKKYFNKSVKKTLSLPRWLNDKAVAAGINFSKVLQNGLKIELEKSNIKCN
ncbi:HicB family protein [Selenomonas caprae]|uniref:HicB family protein n=1 Tax=Selenomonas caprae TaxID=2606905 RepID=A0A5D6WS92_9FIRM|nr:type II toxin-antitoxin system HicB family antitoxin [Selenomonas caprae]TYZ29838.1 HicB family protein [Selenomonas caprae]